MRLLYVDDSGKICLTGHVDESLPYVILSHTWVEGEEITFEDIGRDTRCHKAGWKKLDFIAARAKEQGIKYFWVDTCCIDKRNDAEITTAIRSMYRWYKQSQTCYVFLQDVAPRKRAYNGNLIWEESFGRCRWLSRGWTLQELLAPKQVKFYSDETYLGDKVSLCDILKRFTGIDEAAIRGQDPNNYTHLTRIRWADNRVTTVDEDRAYALMGLCEVSMAPRYGEGYDAARLRLENKIRKRFGTIALETDNKAAIMPESSREALLNRLKFDVMNARKQTINKAMQKTCAWIRTHPTFQAWLRYDPEQNGFFWIKGHPGTGKSVLMKHVDEYISRTKEAGDISISFYFNARGGDLEKSFLGLYRSLLVQLLEAMPEIENLPENISQDIESNVVALQDLIEHVYAHIGQRRLFCFVDALDECQEEDVSELIEFLQSLGQSAACSNRRILTCFASRHYPIVEVPTRCQLVLEEVDHHSEDMELYMRQKLPRGNYVFVEQIIGDIMLKANGIFLWVVLVMEILKKEITNGRTHTIRERLKALPPGLTELFKNIIRQGEEHNEYLILCLRWILYAQRPLALAEFYFAMMVSIGESGDTRQNSADDEIMLRFLTSSSKGLAELTKGKIEQVQFIHESVRDFLRREKEFEQIVAEESHSLPKSHAFLARACINGMYDDGECSKFASLRTDNTSKNARSKTKIKPLTQDERQDVITRFPFFSYSVTFVLAHIDSAAATNDLPNEVFDRFFNQCDRDTWALKMNFLQTTEVAMYQMPVDLAYLCAERDLVNLLQATRNAGFALDGRRIYQRYETPLIAALANKSMKVARLFLTETGASDTEGGEIIKEVIIDSHRGKSVYDRYQRHEVIWALSHKHHKLSTCLLQNFDRSYPDTLWNEALVLAAGAGYKDCVVLSWEALVDVSELAWYQMEAAVREATTNHHTEIVMWLLAAAQTQRLTSKNVSTLQLGDIRRSALQAAVRMNHIDILEMLLGPDFDMDDEAHYSVALSSAAGTGKQDVAGSLLKTCELRDPSGGARDEALRQALFALKPAMVKLLLDNGALSEDSALVHEAVSGEARNYPTSFIISVLNIDSDRGKIASLSQSMMHSALKANRREILQLVVGHRCMDDVDESSELRLIEAAQGGRTESVRKFLDAGSNVDATTRFGTTALMWASYFGHVDIARLLLDAGAGMDISTNEGWTALSLASRSGSLGIVQMLVARRADPNIEVRLENGEQVNALSHAAEKGHIYIVRLLLYHGANADGPFESTYSPLWKAAFNGHTEVVETLLAYNPNSKLQDLLESDWLYRVKIKGYIRIAELIDKYYAKMSH